MAEKRIGIIGGMSWESTGVYYSLLNRMHPRTSSPWAQPRVVIDSLDFGQVVALQTAGDWDATGRLLADSARRLVLAGATVLAIGANTMHRNFREVQAAVSVPVVDVRAAVASEVRALGSGSVSLMGTRYVIEQDFYSDELERLGITVIKPTTDQADELQRIVFDELTRGIVSPDSRASFIAIAEDCRARGGLVAGLCCTEFGMLIDETNAPFPFVDSTVAHVRALLSHVG
jgi:aspartate racemase